MYVIISIIAVFEDKRNIRHAYDNILLIQLF